MFHNFKLEKYFMAKDDIVTDLETLGVVKNSIILSLGAVKFDRTESIYNPDSFYKVISIESCKALGMIQEQHTIDWWNSQSSDARQVFNEPSYPIEVVLEEFMAWCAITRNSRVWGNGYDFDNEKIKDAYELCCGKTVPWNFRQNRCYRTVADIFKLKLDRPQFQGVQHNAMWDAWNEGRHLFQMLKYLETH